VVDTYRDANRRGIYLPLFTDPEGVVVLVFILEACILRLTSAVVEGSTKLPILDAILLIWFLLVTF